MTRRMSFAIWLLALPIAVLALVWFGQRRLIYFPSRDVPTPESLGLGRVEAASFTTTDGLTLNGWFFPSTRQPAPFTVVVFNGNAGNRAYRVGFARALRAQGLAILLFDYRGFGENPGAPTERGLAADARAARAYVAARRDVDPARLVYFGESLGAAVAIELATEHQPAALILRSPFTSMADVGRFHYPLLPVGLLLRDRFASIDRIPRLRSPLLVIAGNRDSIVPLEQSRRLFDAAVSPKSLEIIDGADHNDAALFDGERMMRAIERFLATADEA